MADVIDAMARRRTSKPKHRTNGTAEAPRGTLDLARGYHGPHEATNLVNCLLGLLLLTPEPLLARLPETPLSRLRGWGISSRTMQSRGRGTRHPKTLRQLVRSLRESAGQVVLRGSNGHGTVSALEFGDPREPKAVIGADDLRRFVERLAVCLGAGEEIDAGRARFVASLTQRPYHLRECKWVRRISRRNLRGVRNRRSALKSGHRPCKVCKP